MTETKREQRSRYNAEMRRQAREQFAHNISMFSEKEREAEMAAYDSVSHDHEIPFLVDEETGQPIGKTTLGVTIEIPEE
jgi:hypothetical protein